ncbi:restriction endonuclease [Candidatus Pacearchaeota archaeon]|nr:restriction endonuclease [Candidatus Pacearchaeota archaeon]
MIDNNRERKGNSLENEISDMFSKIGFKTEIRSKKFEFESDVIATRGNFIILIQAKRYDETQIDIDSLIEEWKEKGDKVSVDKILIIVTGHKNINDDYIKKAKQKGIYLWNENYLRKLRGLDLIDLYEEIGKNLEIKEVLKRIKEYEEEKLNSLYEKIENLEDKKKNSIFEQLEKLEFTDYTKREIQLKKIENEILLEKEKEIEEQSKEKVEDIEFEELFRLTNSSTLNFSKRYAIINKIGEIPNLSEKSKRILAVEKIKTFLEKQQEESSNEDWGDEKLDKLEELRKEGKISLKAYLRFKEKTKEIGASKSGISNAERKGYDYDLDKAVFKKKLIKLAIRLGVLAIIFIIIWRVLF